MRMQCPETTKANRRKVCTYWRFAFGEPSQRWLRMRINRLCCCAAADAATLQQHYLKWLLLQLGLGLGAVLTHYEGSVSATEAEAVGHDSLEVSFTGLGNDIEALCVLI